MQRISINGIETDHLVVTDRAFMYGDGLFETIAYKNGVVEFWDEHITRFKESAGKLSITFPSEEKYRKDVAQLLNADKRKNYVIKLILTRGNTERGYKLADSSNPTRCVILSDWPEFSATNAEEGIATHLCKHPVSLNPNLAGIKHLNRLDNVMARKEWVDEYAEGFMTDGNGNIIEGTMSNVFCVKNNALLTPSLQLAGVNGIIRQQIITLAEEMGIKIQVKDISIDDFYSMDEIFITNSIIGLWPVKHIDRENYSTGSLTCKLKDALKQKTQEHAKSFI